ncbi:UDP-2-acetamido-2,6-beta-L-arabino-hexul-4-ose reductase [Butyrivibrio sp. INlla18]|uniref:polysaccharide biosynthesis C-terminal domain-containing protein n=1 Tax=Butyrivibrio sp. INlla18 TaxID=1520806 RepID=UPI000887A5DF|nr:NAD-dependent epimerase/dehydratase family protein [Butyrivibrio sp. INlla18]SDA73506.1 UDP-2-acetamido-2,6-beta-L-arabino-hexul-4-ose reductase [Butyrivibrio sp. INlla18]
MKILVTGAKGFVGKNLVENLKNIRDGKDRTRPALHIEGIFEYDIDTDPLLLKDYCQEADFVFNLAGVNRPKDTKEFMEGNFGFSSQLLDLLKEYKNTAPIMISSSIQASLEGRFEGSEYGKSKLAGEELFFDYAKETGAKVLVYRFPNLFGKWCRPNYNSAVATFCNNIATDQPIQVNDPKTELELVYIDDLVGEMLDALEGNEHTRKERLNEAEVRALMEVNGSADEGNGASARKTVAVGDSREYCYVPVSHKVTLGEIVELLNKFKDMPKSLVIPDIPEGSFAKKLYSTYLSYLPADKMIYDIPMAVDERGHFTELIKSLSCGQVSINISKPGVTKGQHWHNSKWEIFIVVSGKALIQERKLGIDPETGKEYPVVNFEVSGDKIQAVQMLPGYTHNIINLSDTEDLVTVMWANEIFDEKKPETYREIVE